MIARLFGLIAALLISGCNVAEPERDWPEPSPALWQVTAPSGEIGWLFGTVHALPDGLKWRNQPLAEAQDAARLLIVEIDDPGSAQSGSLFRDLAETPGQPALSQRVPKKDRPALRALMERADVEDGDFSRLETWAAALMLANMVRDTEPANGVDRALMAEAPTVLALETMAGQLRVFDSLAERDQSALLAGTAREIQADDGGQSLAAWLTGDLAVLEQMTKTGILADPDLYDALLADRNRAWVDRVIAAIIADRRPLVAVGAAHMLGEHGLPAMLEARGFMVRRIQ